ncbi:hypothetical protein PR048_010833 [Dryococelus australis]|uniref:Transposase n=1 Tax=Dryococelus australis TaxID=614101 RepID=A0ABQ9I3U0_9NEOP|nr:hypothetical protein PR048_010833 [Dryococelus australis]
MVQKKITAGNNFTLTYDTWIETNSTKEYRELTLHYLEDEDIHSAMFGVESSEYLGRKLEEICNKWNIQKEKVSAVVTDNGKNIVKAAKDTWTKPTFALLYPYTGDGFPEANVDGKNKKMLLAYQI